MPGLLARCWKYQNWNLFTYTQRPESRVQNPESRVQSPVHVLACVFFKKMHILIYIGRCVHHTHVIFLVSEKLALSSQNELQMFSLIPGRHIGKPLWSTNMASPYKTFFKLREKLQQIIHKPRTAETWELERWFINLFPITSQVLVLFHWTVSNLFFSRVIVKTIH